MEQTHEEEIKKGRRMRNEKIAKSLQRISEQSKYLSTQATMFSDLYRSLNDSGQYPPTKFELEKAKDRMREALLTVIRVTAEFL